MADKHMESNNTENKNMRSNYTPLSDSVGLFHKDKIDAVFTERLKTGFPQLDKYLGGGISSGVIVLGAVSNLGKSTFALQLAQNIASEETPVIFFSLEMTPARIASKSLSRQIFIDSEKNRANSIEADKLMRKEYVETFDSKMWKRINLARETVAQNSKYLYIVENSVEALSAAKIYNCTKEFIEKEQKKPFVIVDYLQILATEDAKLEGRYAVNESIRYMSQLAAEDNLPILLISSLNRNSYDSPIDMASFKETGNIEYSSDVVLGMQLSGVGSKSFNPDREKRKSPRSIEIVILKQRYGVSGQHVPFEYYSDFDYFCEKGEPELEDIPETIDLETETTENTPLPETIDSSDDTFDLPEQMH